MWYRRIKCLLHPAIALKLRQVFRTAEVPTACLLRQTVEKRKGKSAKEKSTTPLKIAAPSQKVIR